jgi:hypothetical protein
VKTRTVKSIKTKLAKEQLDTKTLSKTDGKGI